MPHCTTKYFETVDYEEASVLHFPAGLPGFENERRFLSLEQPANKPMVFLQSLASPDLCFIALPVQAVEPSYELEVEESDLELLGLDRSRQTSIKKDLLGLALVTVEEDGMLLANLFAPVVINTVNLRAVQAISPTGRYSHRHPLVEEPVQVEEPVAVCS
jgi:flagellar assembly factor FliW